MATQQNHQNDNSRSGGTTPVSDGAEQHKEMQPMPMQLTEEMMDMVAHHTRGSVSSDSKSETDEYGSSSHNK